MALLERAEATTHYVTLGLGSTATQEEIRGAYYLPESDIVFSSGSFVQWPEGRQN